jgi:outer membrane cobalamin receptor
LRAALPSRLVATAFALVALVRPALAEEPAAGSDATPVYDVYVTSPRDRAEQVATVRRLDRRDFAEENARTLDEALVHVPNVVVRTGGDGVPRIDVRGLRSRHLSLLVDGVPYNSAADGQFDASLVPTQLIERIDLVTSQSSVLYGDGGIGGVLQIRTRKPAEELEATGSFDVRERGQYQPEATLSGSLGDLEGFAAGRYLRSKGYQLPDSFDSTSVENGDLRENSDRDQGNFFGKLGYTISPEARVGVLADFRKAEFGVPPNVVDDPSDRFAPRTRYERVEDLEGFSTQLSGSLEPEGPLSLRGWGFVNRQEEDRRRYDDASYDTISRNGSFRIEETALLAGGAVHGRYDAAEGFGALRFATNGRYERYDVDGISCVTGGGGGGGGASCGTVGSARPFTPVDTDEDLGVFSLGAEYEVELFEALGLVAGYSHAFLEAESGVDEDGSILLAGATYDLPTETRLRASAARKIRFPSVVQLYDPNGGNVHLESEHCWCFEVGVEQALPWATTFGAVGFWQELRNFIERDTNQVFQNRQKIRLRGVELSLSSRPIEPVELRLSYAWLDTEDRSSDAVLSDLPNRPEHTVDLDVRYTHPWNGDLRVGLRTLDGIEQDSRNAPFEMMDLDGFTTVDARIAQRFFGDHFELYFGVDNVFDEKGEINFGFPLAGRTFLGGGIVRL